jgi:hypothetical protein
VALPGVAQPKRFEAGTAWTGESEAEHRSGPAKGRNGPARLRPREARAALGLGRPDAAQPGSGWASPAEDDAGIGQPGCSPGENEAGINFFMSSEN